MSDLPTRLRKYCGFQRAKEQGLSDYPEEEHKRDCELCQAADILEQTQAYKPYPKDQALAGESMPPMKSILDLIRYCTTVHKRFGNTCVDDLSLKWGGSALNFKSDLQTRIEQLEAALRPMAKAHESDRPYNEISLGDCRCAFDLLETAGDSALMAKPRRLELKEGREHLTITNEFQSDKYQWCPAGFLPIKVTDSMAADLLEEYAERRKSVDPEFSRDLHDALLEADA